MPSAARLRGRLRRAVLAACGVTVASAALAVRGAAQTAPDTTHRPLLDATRLTPGHFFYQLTLERDSGTTLLGTRSVDVSRTMYVNTPAWLLVDARATTGIAALDSLYVDATDLHAMHWSAVLGDARLAAEFRGDTAYGGSTAPAGRNTFTTVVPAGTLVNTAMLESALRLLPLGQGFADSLLTLSVKLGSIAVLPTQIAVIGDDRVRLPSGAFDCWVVSVHAGDGGRGLFWVSKTNPLVVRSTMDVPLLGGAQLVTTLMRVGP